MKELIRRIEQLEARISGLESSIPSDTDYAACPIRIIDEFSFETIRTPRRNEDGSLDFWLSHFSDKKSSIENTEQLQENLAEIERTKPSEWNILYYDWINGFRLLLLSDGRLVQTTESENTRGIINRFAAEAGVAITDAGANDSLAKAIIAEKGCDGICICNNRMLTQAGEVTTLNEVNCAAFVARASEESNSFDFAVGKPDFANRNSRECLELIRQFFNGISPKPLPPVEEIRKQYIEAVEKFRKTRSLYF